MDLISIIVPVYKVEQYLPECIDSIIGQSYSNLQIILVDDGSPDNCGAICDAYAAKDNRIMVIHSENGGLSAARNRGFQVCRGKYIYFVDSDDYLEPNAVEVLYQAAEKDNLDMLMYDALSFDETNPDAPMDDINKYIRKSDYSTVQTGAQLFLRMLKNDEYRSPVQYCFYRKSFLDAYQLSFHEGVLHEDEEFNFFALLNAQRVKHISNILYYHRFRADSIMGLKITKRNVDSCFEILQAYIKKSEAYLTNPQTAAAYQTGVARFLRIYYSRVHLSGEQSPDTELQIKQLRRSLKKAHYYGNPDVKRAAFNRQKKHRIKKLKMRLYPHAAKLLRRK